MMAKSNPSSFALLIKSFLRLKISCVLFTETETTPGLGFVPVYLCQSLTRVLVVITFFRIPSLTKIISSAGTTPSLSTS